jgi:RNA polymerase sigma-70 factor (ECF subfamily)
MLSHTAFASVAAAVAHDRGDVVDPRVLLLVEQAKAGSALAFAELYDRYVDRVHAFVLRRVGDHALAEDLTADVFTRMLRRIDTFTFTGSDPIAWLLTIARNRVHDHFRSARFRLERVEAGTGSDLRDEGAGPSAGLERAAVVTEVRAALALLRPDHAEVLHLRFVEELSVAEAAQVLGRKEGAVRALQFRALKALAALVDVEAVAS